MTDTTREWHRIEFLSKGAIAKEPEAVTHAAGHPSAGEVSHWKHREYHPQTAVGYGYYVVENQQVVAVVDERGKPLPHGEPSHECRVLSVHTECPYA